MIVTEQQLTPLGELLERARGPLSKREAARLAGISEGRWRQVVTGVQKAGGMEIPANPRRKTVIAMANAVRADIDEALRLAGFEPAPADTTRTADDRDAMISDVAEAIRRDTALIEEARQHLLNQYELLRRLSPPQKSSPPRSRTRDLRAVAHDGNPEDRAEIERRAREARRRHEQEETRRDDE